MSFTNVEDHDTKHINAEDKNKIKAFDKLLQGIQIKIQNSTTRAEKIYALTIVPSFWPRRKTCYFFNVNDNMVRVAQSLDFLAYPKSKNKENLMKQLLVKFLNFTKTMNLVDYFPE